ncbi:hypothetical protein ACT3TS_12570 [Specibacter sp. AOP5-B1-6]|uniref:hypothetical protein n=1 Tax=Specibacter sp. AOP5-B1-6 TaxID=3457653 RepID=UPI003FB8F0CD
MDTPHTAKLHLEIDLMFDDPAAVQRHAGAWAREQSDGGTTQVAELLSQAAEGPESALMMLIEPDDVVGAVPGVTALGASLWIDGSSEAAAPRPAASSSDYESDLEESETGELDLGDLDPDELDLGGLESEEDWLRTIFQSADKLPGLELELLGYDQEEPSPDLRSRSLRRATNLRGAMHWAFEFLVDQLFDDVSTLRTEPEAVAETMQLGDLPPLHRAHYGPLFAQRFLAVTLDLGTSLATSYRSPTCVAQELALRLLLDCVEILQDMLPALELAEDWRGSAEDNLFEDLDHELLYDPAFDGIASSPLAGQLGMANLDVSSWFTPFFDRAVNPYAANE